MDCTANKIKDILVGMGFTAVESDTDNAVIDERNGADLSILSKFDLKGEKPQKLVSMRKVRYKNEYHDEMLTQIQATVYCEPKGLGVVKGLVEKVAAAYCGEEKAIALRPQFIYQVVPGIELSLDGNKLAGGGVVRPEIPRKMDLDIAQDCFIVTTFVAEGFKNL